jgi:hypothetical protein
MRHYTLILILLACFSVQTDLFAQGQFAGTKSKALIGTQYNNDRVLAGLPDYEYREANLLADEGSPEQFVAVVFQKGPTYIVFFGLNEDTLSDNYTILDVLVVKQVKKNQAVKVVLCRQKKVTNAELVAVVQPGSSAYSPALRAWRFNRDKRRFELASVKGVDCMNEGDD